MEVTIIIPTYKRLHYLSQAIESVVQQTYKNWTCLIINDYPPDGKAIAQLLQKINDSRFVLIDCERSQGGNVARNKGIKIAKGEIIAFLDDDDLWLPNKLEKHLERHQQNPQAGLIYSGVKQCWDEETLPPKITEVILPKGEIIEAMRQGIFCPHSTSGVTVRRHCFKQCGMFDENLISFQDWDMWFRIAQSYSFDCVNSALIVFRQHLGDRTSQSVQCRLQGLEQIISKWSHQLVNQQQFRNIFTKEVYINHTNKLILQKNYKEAFTYWQKLLKISNSQRDLLQASKLAILFLFGTNFYQPLLKSYRYLVLKKRPQ